MRCVPRRMRFGAAMRIAAAATPLLRDHVIVRSRLQQRVETAREIVTYHLLDILTRHGVAFDPRMRSQGAGHFDAAVAENRGVLLIAPHAMLTTLSLRLLHDAGKEVLVVATFDTPIPGTSLTAPAILPSFTYLLEVRRRLRANAIVTAMIDRAEIDSRTAVSVDTSLGSVIIADALIQVAVRSNVPVLFAATRIIDGEMVIVLDRPSGEESQTAEGVRTAFIAFLLRHVDCVARERGLD
ncbi:MAG TPA: hypothetical protein VE010_11880 [Thermoanaerobaculia bacterium]|nr:hypothetical protein [Thermoanaerobaculia bacterium]